MTSEVSLTTFRDAALGLRRKLGEDPGSKPGDRADSALPTPQGSVRRRRVYLPAHCRRGAPRLSANCPGSHLVFAVAVVHGHVAVAQVFALRRPLVQAVGGTRLLQTRRVHPRNSRGGLRITGLVLRQSPLDQRRPKYPAMNKIMTTRPTSQMILFTRLFLFALKIRRRRRGLTATSTPPTS